MEARGRLVIRDLSQEVITVANETSYSGAAILCDFVFVIDTTGSMSDKIQGLLATCEKFVDELARHDIDWRVAVEAFGDLTVPGDTIQATGFSSDVETIRRSFRNIPRNSGGGNDGESSLEALNKAISLKGYRQSAVKIFIFLTDEPALRTRFTPAQTTSKLVKSEILVFIISKPYDYFKEMARFTGGKWFQISSGTNFLDILDRLFKKVSETAVEIEQLASGSVEEYLKLKVGS